MSQLNESNDQAVAPAIANLRNLAADYVNERNGAPLSPPASPTDSVIYYGAVGHGDPTAADGNGPRGDSPHSPAYDDMPSGNEELPEDQDDPHSPQISANEAHGSDTNGSNNGRASDDDVIQIRRAHRRPVGGRHVNEILEEIRARRAVREQQQPAGSGRHSRNRRGHGGRQQQQHSHRAMTNITNTVMDLWAVAEQPLAQIHQRISLPRIVAMRDRIRNVNAEICRIRSTRILTDAERNTLVRGKILDIQFNELVLTHNTGHTPIRFIMDEVHFNLIYLPIDWTERAPQSTRMRLNQGFARRGNGY